MEKVKISKEVAEVIESNRKGGRSDEDVIKLHAGNPQGWLTPALHNIPLDTLIRALYIGYEVEQSKEEKVREVISSFCNGAIVSEWVIEDIKKIYEGVNE